LLIDCYKLHTAYKLELAKDINYLNIEMIHMLNIKIKLFQKKQVEFFLTQKKIFEIEDKLKKIVQITEFEFLQKQKTEEMKKLHALTIVPPDYSLTLEQTLDFMDVVEYMYNKVLKD